tara:strand:+ start:191 stop:487 length:297 start_codon:yes stop_codon:yes gene_type:complete
MSQETVEREGEFSRVVQEMRLRAGLTIPELAEKMGVTKGAVHQYLYRLRGDGGTSTMKWFLRLARVCRCEVTVTFPAVTDRARRRYGDRTHDTTTDDH